MLLIKSLARGDSVVERGGTGRWWEGGGRVGEVKFKGRGTESIGYKEKFLNKKNLLSQNVRPMPIQLGGSESMYRIPCPPPTRKRP